MDRSLVLDFEEKSPRFLDFEEKERAAFDSASLFRVKHRCSRNHALGFDLQLFTNGLPGGSGLDIVFHSLLAS